MSPWREALLLPCLFLTVALLGGLRIGGDVRLVPPPVAALVLAVLLMSALVRSRALVPERLLHSRRAPIENLCGFVVLIALFAASAQIFNLLMPDRGLLHLVVGVFFVVQLLTTLAAVRDRLSLLRAVAVLFGCAFVLRFIALESMYAPGRGLVKRVMTALLEGVTLGALEYEPVGAATGYIAFLVLALFLTGLILIGSESPTTALAVRNDSTSVTVRSLAMLLCLGLSAAASTACGQRTDAAGTAPPTGVSDVERDAILAAARVWTPPSTPIDAADLGRNPTSPWTLQASDEVSCQFVAEPVGGTTPKFNCRLPTGEVVKVKYGARNPELFAEVAATRLLSALGFPADNMYLVARVRCSGCPRYPFQALRCQAGTFLGRACFLGGLDERRTIEFAPAVVESRADGRKIESPRSTGWGWYELERIDPSRGGSTRAHLDALRLLAVLLAHWDNKSENQRLICRGPSPSCGDAVALLQDLGATFGPLKLDLQNWRRVPVWADARACLVSMENLPYGGGTFPPARISESGRILLATLLEQLSPAQVRALFAGSGVTAIDSVSGESRNADAWARAFLDKVRQVREAGPCPAGG